MTRQQDIYLYIHFPFCVKKCHYCDFYSVTDLELIENYFIALQKEIVSCRDVLINRKIKSIYIGGGSPNLIPLKFLEMTIQTIGKLNTLQHLEEFTIEINPGNVSQNQLNHFKTLGINRISIGAQSFNDMDLEFLGRIHNADQIFATLEMVNNAGITNRSLDLIYGIPEQRLSQWQSNLKQAIQTGAEHFSFYNLIYEPGTPLTKARDDNKLTPLDDDIEFEMFHLAHQFLNSCNYHHYEISNWAKPGLEARHNSAYWNHSNYLGFGPAAHTYIHDHRRSNVRSLKKYIERVNAGKPVVDFEEKLTAEMKLSEFIFLGLRTANGMSIKKFESLAQLSFKKIINQMEQKFNQSFMKKYANINDENLALSIEGWFVCDYIVEQFLLTIEEIKDAN